LGWGLSGAMGAIALAYFVTAFFSFLLLFFSLKAEGVKISAKEDFADRGSPNILEAYRYVFPVGLTLLCFMVLTNIDLILVKHFFTPIEAGYYSISQMVGKIILVLPIPMVTVMFPHLFSSEGQEKKARLILGRNLRIAGFLCGGATLCAFIFPSPILKILSGKIYPECLLLVGLFSVNMTFFSLMLILLYYHLFTSRRGFLYPLLLFTLMEVGLILLFHDTLVQVLTVVGIVAFCLVLINFYLIYRSHPMKEKESV
jgi:O-antigen/teichoic acid export membrane protein